MSGTCPIPWCSTGHTAGAPGRGHVLELGPFPGPDPRRWAEASETRVMVLQLDEEDGTPGTPFVRIVFNRNGETRVMEVSTAAAADLGDLLACQLGVVRRDLSAALVGTYWLTGGGE